jgi:hypothetical protein
VQDNFIFIPNLVGALMGIVQIGLKTYYNGRHNSDDTATSSRSRSSRVRNASGGASVGGGASVVVVGRRRKVGPEEGEGGESVCEVELEGDSEYHPAHSILDSDSRSHSHSQQHKEKEKERKKEEEEGEEGGRVSEIVLDLESGVNGGKGVV